MLFPASLYFWEKKKISQKQNKRPQNRTKEFSCHCSPYLQAILVPSPAYFPNGAC